MQSVPIVGEALSLPPRYETACSVEWYHVRHSTNSPKLIRDCRFIPRGRLRASPTVLSWCCGNSPNPVHHFWLVLRGRLVAAPTVTAQKRYRAPPRSPGCHTSSVRIGVKRPALQIPIYLQEPLKIGLTTRWKLGKIILSMRTKKEGTPWTPAAVAIYRAEVGCGLLPWRTLTDTPYFASPIFNLIRR